MDTTDTGDELRRLAVRGAGVTILSGGTGLAIQVLATVVLARALTPRDFGLVAMVTTFSLLLVNFGLNGITEAVVQREEINNSLASTLFWITLAAGGLLTIGFAAAGSLLALFYHDSRVREVAVGISPIILITSSSVMHLALLKRSMRFSDLSFNDIRARVLSVAVSILLAWAGLGYWALIAGGITLPLSVSIGAWRLCRWVPGRPCRVSGTGEMLRFALSIYGNFTVNYFSRNTDNLLVGWRFSAQSLGFYKKAYDLFALSASQLVASISIVVVAALSRVRQNDKLYRMYLLGAMAGMAFIGMAVAAELTLVGRDLIRLLLGPAWDPAGRIFTYFSPGIGMMILYSTHGWIHLSIGRADRWLRWGIVEFVVTCSLFAVGLHWGPVGIASAWTVSFWILTIPALWYAGRPIKLGVTSMLAVIWRYLVASISAATLTGFIVARTSVIASAPGVPGAILRIAVVTPLLGVTYLAAVVGLHGGLEPLSRLGRLVREMLPASDRSASQPPVQALGVGAYSAQAERAASVQTNPLVSILIPAYNGQEWIADTIRSAIAQTWNPKEIIVVDDGSTDRTLEIARQFESLGVRVVKQENQGAAAARNTAYSLSHGDYIQWLDADDLLASDKIALQMSLVRDEVGPRTLLSSSWGQFMYRPNRARFVPTQLWCDLPPVEWLLRKLRFNVFMQTGVWLVSRELCDAAGPWDTRLLYDDDGEYLCRVLLACEGVRFVREAKVYYRKFGFDSLSYVDGSDAKLNAHWLSMKLHVGYLRSLEDSPRVHVACLEYLRTCLVHFYLDRPDIVCEIEQLAQELGQKLGVPTLPWKYSYVERIFGWRTVIPLQRSLRRCRWSLQKRIDKMLFRVQAAMKPESIQEHDNGGWEIF